ncbi:GntR family transcriptional regulator [Streptomyces sioyaensis]|uniref:GntR family transcriptional regulator n=1 Tax=Streptomyces sioyaensis TaxID=67364 RepID=UPI003D7320E4
MREGKRATRHEGVVDELRRAIGREDYGEGSLLPVEAELAARYGVWRGMVCRPSRP